MSSIFVLQAGLLALAGWLVVQLRGWFCDRFGFAQVTWAKWLLDLGELALVVNSYLLIRWTSGKEPWFRDVVVVLICYCLVRAIYGRAVSSYPVLGRPFVFGMDGVAGLKNFGIPHFSMVKYQSLSPRNHNFSEKPLVSTRVETKYLLNFAQYQYLKERFRLSFTRDPHCNERPQYPVFSRYYDTPQLRFFYDKIDGEFEHVKIRLRKYSINFLDDKGIFLEAKMKEGQHQRKLRIKRDFDVGLLDWNSWNEIEDPQIDYFLQITSQERLIPTCNVYYEREPYHIDVGGHVVRVNFDTNLLFLYPDEMQITSDLVQTRLILDNHAALLEIKHDSLDSIELIAKELRYIGATQTSNSKYASAMLCLDSQTHGQEIVL